MGVVVVSHIQRIIGCQPEKTTLHGGQSRSWSAEHGKENKIKSLAAYPPPPHPLHCSFGEKKKKKKNMRRIYRRYAGLGRSRVRTRISSARRLRTRPMGVASQNSTLLPSAIRNLLVSLLLSSPGDVWPRLTLLTALSKTYSRLCLYRTDSPVEYNVQTAALNTFVLHTIVAWHRT